MNKKPDPVFITVLFAATFFTFLFHEFGHWTIGELLGNRMTMTFNSACPQTGKCVNDWNAVYVLIGGPLFSLIQAAAVLILIIKFKKLYLYPFLFFPFLMRVFSLAADFKLEDEAKISSMLKIGMFTVPVLVTLALFFLMKWGSIVLKIGPVFNLFCAVYSIIFLIMLVNINKILF
jgi:hypothetical protein